MTRTSLTNPAAGRTLSGKLGRLSIPRQVLTLAIWPFLEGLLAWLVGTVDLALAGRLPQGKVPALDALGVSAYLGWLMAMIFQSVGVGAAALIARAAGARHKRLANSALGQGLLVAAAFGALTGLAVVLLGPVIANLTNLSERAADMFLRYLMIVCAAAPGFALMLAGAAALRAAGETRSPFFVMLMVNAVNVLVSAMLVFGPPPFGGYGVAGIAAGTALAWTLGAVATVIILMRGRPSLRLRWIRLMPRWTTMRRIVRVGIPNLLESVAAMWLGNFIVLMMIGRLALEGTIGAHMIAVRIESVSFQPGFALGIAAATLAGQYLGLGDPDRARRAVKWCWCVGAGTMTATGLVFIAVPETMVRLITDSQVALRLAPPLVRLCGLIQFPFACYLVFAGALRGTGDTRTTMRLTTLSTFLVRVPAVALAVFVLDAGLFGVWIALCGELTVRGALFSARFLHGGWTRVQV